MIRPRSLTSRLVITAVALVAVVSVLIGAFAALATRYGARAPRSP